MSLFIFQHNGFSEGRACRYKSHGFINTCWTPVFTCWQRGESPYWTHDISLPFILVNRLPNLVYYENSADYSLWAIWFLRILCFTWYLKIDNSVFYLHHESKDKRRSSAQTSHLSGILTRAWMLTQNFRNTLVSKIQDEGVSFRRQAVDQRGEGEQGEGRADEGEGRSAHLMDLLGLVLPFLSLGLHCPFFSSGVAQVHQLGRGAGAAGANSSTWTLFSSSTSGSVWIMSEKLALNEYKQQ